MICIFRHLSIHVKNCGKKCGFFIKVALFELTIH